jgi:biotin-[acetyl-CoA-carboxylase] ligase BirA-like protein
MNKISFNIINFDSIDSTSTYLKQSYDKLDDLTLVFASFQTSGHGRMKRDWVSPKGDSLLFSILFKNENVIKNFPSLSLMSACYVRKFLLKYIDNVSIKWPNDVYVNGKKICGILLESVSLGDSIDAVILGIGININIKSFNDELKNKATSLYLETNKTFNIDDLKDDLIKSLKQLVLAINSSDKGYLEVIRTNNYLLDKYPILLLELFLKKAVILLYLIE